MKHHLTVKGQTDPEVVRRWLARPLARLRRQLTHFPPDAVHLRTLVRDVDGRPRSEASVALQLPSNTLAASEEGPDPRWALEQAFTEVERLLGKEKARLRRRGTWRKAKEDFQRELVERIERQSDRAFAGTDIDRLTERLRDVERFVSREIEWLEFNGDLVRGEIDAGDVVDSAVVLAFTRAQDQGEGWPAKQQLLRSALTALRAEVARARDARQLLHIEEDVPETPPETAVSTLGSEILDFFQPDDDLMLRDILSAVAPSPEEITASSDWAQVLRSALSALPASWRQALHLSQVEDLDALAIAEALEIQEDAVTELRDRARAFLIDRLLDAGLLTGEAHGSPR